MLDKKNAYFDSKKVQGYILQVSRIAEKVEGKQEEQKVKKLPGLAKKKWNAYMRKNVIWRRRLE